MHLRLAALFSFTLFVAPLPSHGAATQLSLEEALGAAEQANLSVLIGREAVAQAQALADRQRTTLLPRVSLDAQQRRTKSVQISQGVPTGVGPNNRFDGSLTGNLAVLDPAEIANYRAARLGIGIAESDYLQAVQGALASVGETFFAHLRNLQRTSVLDANIARARALLDLAERQLAAGVATQIDVTRAEAQLAVVEQARIQQNTVVIESELQMKRLLNLEPNSPLTLLPFPVRRVQETELPAVLGREMLARRVEYVRAEQVLEQNRTALKAAKLERLGTLNVFGEYGVASARVLDGKEKEAWEAGVSVSVPVFDAGRVSANQRIAQAAVRAQEFRVRNLELSIGAELQLAVQDARSRYLQIGVAERSLRLAEDELRLAQIRFERGAADNREVIEAQNRLAVASDNLVEATFQYNVSRLELARARGDVRLILGEKSE